MLPRDLAEILRRVRSGTFEMRHEHQHLEESVNRVVLGIMSSAFFLGSSIMMAGKVPPAPGDISIIGAIGYVVSMIFGYRLLRVINKAQDPDKKN